MYRIAIDPGKSGALAWIDNKGIYHSSDCPDTISEMADLAIKVFTESNGHVEAIIESVHAMPGQGVTSMFSFGENFGAWQGIISSLGVPTIEVTPQRWQKIIGNLPKEKNERKKALKDYAQKRVPYIKATLKNADAIAMLTIFGQLWKE